MFKLPLLSCLFVLSSLQSYAATSHIADDVQLFMHSGPSYEYRITGRVRSGESIEVLDSKGDYIQIKLSDGKTGWVPNRYVAEGVSQLQQLPEIRDALETSQKTVSLQAEEIRLLKERLASIQAENELSTEEIVKRDTQIRDLNFQIQNMDQSNLMRWLTHGGLIALGGVIIGLIVPHLPKRRKQRDDWF